MKNRSIEITMLNVVISKIQGRKRRDVCRVKRTFSQRKRERERGIVPIVFLAVLTIVITTSDLHFSHGITFPAGECKFERESGFRGSRNSRRQAVSRGTAYNLCGIAYHYRFNRASTICLNDAQDRSYRYLCAPLSAARRVRETNTFRVGYYLRFLKRFLKRSEYLRIRKIVYKN